MKLPSEPSSASHPNTEVPVATRANTPAHLLESGTSRISAKRLQNLLGEVWDEVVTDDCVDLAAQMSYYFSLSLFPFLIVLAATVGWLPSTSLWHNLAQWITDYLPRDSRRMVFTTILNLTQSSPGFSRSGLLRRSGRLRPGFVSLMESLSVAYGVKETRGFWKKRLFAIMATIVGAVFLLGSFGLLTFGHWARPSLFHHAPGPDFQVPWEFGRWLASLLLMLLGLDLMNYFLPNVKRRWHWLTPGTAFVVLTMVAGSAIFNFYLRHFGSYPRFYGTMAGFIILMFWIYLASLILLIGAETDSVIERLHGNARRGSSEPERQPAPAMRTRASVLFFLITCLVGASDSSARAGGQAGNLRGFRRQKVSKVEISVRPTMDAAAFRPLLKIKAGDSFSSAAVQESVKALEQTKQFSKVQVSVEPEQAGLTVLFILEPASYIGIITFPGVQREFVYTRLLQAVNIPEQSPYFDDLLPQGQKAWQKFLQVQGYFSAEVQPRSTAR